MMERMYWGIIRLSRHNIVSRLVIDYVAYLFYKLFRFRKIFKFNNLDYKYYYHLYNRTVASERVVEIPIAKKLLEKYRNKKILEVGNVMSHYFKVSHEILDKYEKGRSIINEDVVDFKPGEKYDLILSVSTLEHVGYSYGEKKDKKKFIKGVKNLQKLLKPKGVLMATFPIHLNPGIDKLYKKNKLPFTKKFYMKRISYLNEWEQITEVESKAVGQYDENFANANLLFVGYFYKNAK